MPRIALGHPIVVALVVTLLNSAKPVVVDDAAYLMFGRHLAVHPGDPYGFEMFWYDVPQPAFEVLAPPLLPYWLGAGIAVFGENEYVLKLWLLPFAVLLTYAVRTLARRFAPGTESVLVPLIALSGFVLPLFGFMLDVPALSLGLAAFAAFTTGRFRNAVVAGFLAGFALQTKYTAVTIPMMFLVYGLFVGTLRHALVSCVICSAVFVAWEAWMTSLYGQSHFLYHALKKDEFNIPWIDQKLSLTKPLVFHLGGLSIGLAVWSAVATGWGRTFVVAGAILAVIGALAITLIPGFPSQYQSRLFYAMWAFFVITVCRCAYRIAPFDSLTSVLLFWIGLEIVIYYVLTPFPAGRRVIGIAVASTFLLARAVSRSSVRMPVWSVAVTPLLGIGLFALDAWDARAEKVVANDAAVATRGGGTVWFNGHWGFQHYCERAGMKPVVPDRSVLVPGDWLVYPVFPDGIAFSRPYHGGAKFRPDERCLRKEHEIVNDDGLPGETIPTLYGGAFPFLGRQQPRLRVAVYRVTATYVPELIP